MGWLIVHFGLFEDLSNFIFKQVNGILIGA